MAFAVYFAICDLFRTFALCFGAVPVTDVLYKYAKFFIVMDQEKYDVFISYSRKDYVDENKNVLPGNMISQIKDAFKDANISYWFDEEGIYSGDQYMEKLANAIMASTAFVFVSSANSNTSDWTAGEIGTAHLYKKTIIPFRLDETPYSPKIIVKISALDYIDCFTNPKHAIKKLVESVLNVKNEEAKRLREEEERRKKERLKARRSEIQQEIQSLASDLRRVAAQQQSIVDQIIEHKNELEETDKNCPVCQKKVSLNTTFCDRCGYAFPLLYGLANNEVDTAQLYTLRGVWEEASAQRGAIEKVVALSASLKDTQKTLQQMESANKEKESLLVDMEKKRSMLQDKLEVSEKKNADYLKQIQSLNSELGKEREKVGMLKSEIEAKAKESAKKPVEMKLKKWVCTGCGREYGGVGVPVKCPICKNYITSVYVSEDKGMSVKNTQSKSVEPVKTEYVKDRIWKCYGCGKEYKGTTAPVACSQCGTETVFGVEDNIIDDVPSRSTELKKTDNTKSRIWKCYGCGTEYRDATAPVVCSQCRSKNFRVWGLT